MYYDYRRIEGYENYIVSNYGEVYSLKRGKVIEMKTQINNRGYKMCGLYSNGKCKIVTIHSIVGNAFIGKREGEMTYDHIDRNRLNNRADNIRLATKSEQMINTGVSKNNKLQEKNIFTKIDKRYGSEYWCVLIERNGKKFRKELNKKKFSLDDAIKVRDEFLRL